jgi:hypothetical protein
MGTVAAMKTASFFDDEQDVAQLDADRNVQMRGSAYRINLSCFFSFLLHSYSYGAPKEV